MKRLFFNLSLLIVTFFAQAQNKIIEKPIIFTENRIQLTLEYLKTHYGLKQEKPTIIPKIIVLHWTNIPTLEKSFQAFYKETLPNWRPDIKKASNLNVSSHFLVDTDGTIYRLMPETTMARHVIGLNHCAIGIENVGGNKGNPLTKKQQEANIWLVNYLAKKYNIEYVIGHYQYTNFENHKLWLEKDKGYRTHKTDPGKAFLAAVLNATAVNNFKPIPQKSK